MDIDFTKNIKQGQFIEDVLEASVGANDYRYICYGGGIRGGKTFGMLGCFMILCKMFPKSKWVIYREDFTALQETTIPSLEKMVAGNASWKWRRDKANYHIEYENGSKIFFYGENISRDPDLDAMLGLECNGIGLEQMEELSIKTFEMGQTRIGSWYIDPMPKPLILGTINPTQKWAKKTFYLPYRENKLLAPYHFIEALPNDNPYVTQEQWDAWNRLDNRYKSQYIKGDWTDFSEKDKRWAWAFDYEKHVAKNDIAADPMHYLYLSFDFNVNPITCAVIQHTDETIYVIEQIKLANSDIYQLCNVILAKYPNYIYFITGDATGQSRSAMVKDNLTYYKIIQLQLKVNPNQFRLPTVNPNIEDNQILVNSILSNYGFKISPNKASALIYDFQNASVNPDNTMKKGDRTDPTQQLDALDCFTGDTLIETNIGQKTIDEIELGDLVLTRNGFSKVIDKWDSLADVYEFEFSNGNKIKCTKDHKFYTHCFGWLPILTIFERNIQICQFKEELFLKKKQNTKELFTTEGVIINTLNKNTSISQIRKTTASAYIAKCGLMPTEKYQKYTTYTTRTEILSTTHLKTLSALMEKNITHSILKRDLSKIQNLQKSFIKRASKPLRRGTVVMQELNGINNTPKKSNSENLITDYTHVIIVEKNIIKKQRLQDSATTTASQHIGENCFVRVKSVKCIGEQKVYDITVQKEHEFIANGFVVHNCARYYMNQFHSHYLHRK